MNNRCTLGHRSSMALRSECVLDAQSEVFGCTSSADTARSTCEGSYRTETGLQECCCSQGVSTGRKEQNTTISVNKEKAMRRKEWRVGPYQKQAQEQEVDVEQIWRPEGTHPEDAVREERVS